MSDLNYLLHLSDGSIRNGLVTPLEHAAALRLNLLFSDCVCVSAPALLRNHLLFDCLDESTRSKDREGLRRAYREGLIRPVVFSDHAGSGPAAFDDVAKVIAKNTASGVGLSDPRRNNDLSLLRRHADAILKSGVHCVITPFTQTNYYSFCLKAAEHSARIPDSVGITGDCATRFTREVERAGDREEFRVVEAYQIADQVADPGTQDNLGLRAIAFTAMEWMSAPPGVNQFSVSGRAVRFVDEWTSLHPRNLSRLGTVESGTDLASFEIHVPWDAIERLTLGEIVDARSQPLIVELRSLVRTHVGLSASAIRGQTFDRFNDLSFSFRKWIAQDTEIGRRGYLSTPQSNQSRLIWSLIALSGPVGAGVQHVAATLSDSFDVSELVTRGIGSVLTVASVVGSARALGWRPPTNTKAYREPSERTDQDLSFDPSSGTTRAPIVDCSPVADDSGSSHRG